MIKRTIRDVELGGRRVFLRVDYNVQFEGAQILDDHRLRESLPTIAVLREAGARIIICSHRGRPGGEVVEELRNAPVAAHLGRLLETEVRSIDECVGPVAKAAVEELASGEIVLLENVRFHAGEETNDPAFAAELASLADLYVNDAFGTAHRPHASVIGVPQILPGVAGLLLEREVDYLTRATDTPERPLVLILGGAKVADKIDILDNLCDIADVICVGGAISNTFLKAQGIDTGASLVEDNRIDEALSVMRQAAERNGLRLVLPTDVVISDALGESVRTVSVNRVPPDFRILDLGPQTIEDFRDAINSASTVVWNGPLGFFEREPFDRGSIEIARIIAASSAITVVGGGETAAVVSRAGVSEMISHVSTGGGASLAMMQGLPLPGIEALPDA
jgi:phosphoglycerate kinase